MLARLSMLMLTALLALSALRAGSVAVAAPVTACASACASAVDADLDGVLPELEAPDGDTDPHDAHLAVARSLFPQTLLIRPVLPAPSAAPCRSYRRPALRPPSRA